MDADLGGLFRTEILERGFRAFLPALRALHPGMQPLEQYLQRAGWAGRSRESITRDRDSHPTSGPPLRGGRPSGLLHIGEDGSDEPHDRIGRNQSHPNHTRSASI